MSSETATKESDDQRNLAVVKKKEPGLAQEYLGWLFATLPFRIPWMFINAYIKKRFGFDGEFLKHPDALIPNFGNRLLANSGLWLSSYGTAWLLFQYIKQEKKHLKYIEKAPPSNFVLTEVVRSFGGILVLTLYQGLYRARSKASRKLSGLKLLLCALGVALWGDFHFYATHRLMHAIPSLYRRVHKVHHLSKNVDPWSGLSMHPVEHIIYFSALLPLLLLPNVPAGAVQSQSDGLVTFPIPAHIGLWPFEKHHFQHHTEFNYNYGSSPLFDIIFGSDFAAYTRRKLAGKQTTADKTRADEAGRQAELTV